MSEYVVTETQYKDQDCLVQALKDVGYREVEVGERLRLYGYRGDVRQETAEVVVRRKHVGASANDIGFARGGDGRFQEITSRFDRGATFTQTKRDMIAQRYARNVLGKQLARVGRRVVTEEAKNGRIYIKAR